MNLDETLAALAQFGEPSLRLSRIMNRQWVCSIDLRLPAHAVGATCEVRSGYFGTAAPAASDCLERVRAIVPNPRQSLVEQTP